MCGLNTVRIHTCVWTVTIPCSSEEAYTQQQLPLSTTITAYCSCSCCDQLLHWDLEIISMMFFEIETTRSWWTFHKKHWAYRCRRRYLWLLQHAFSLPFWFRVLRLNLLYWYKVSKLLFLYGTVESCSKTRLHSYHISPTNLCNEYDMSYHEYSILSLHTNYYLYPNNRSEFFRLNYISIILPLYFELLFLCVFLCLVRVYRWKKLDTN